MKPENETYFQNLTTLKTHAYRWITITIEVLWICLSCDSCKWQHNVLNFCSSSFLCRAHGSHALITIVLLIISVSQENSFESTLMPSSSKTSVSKEFIFSLISTYAVRFMYAWGNFQMDRLTSSRPCGPSIYLWRTLHSSLKSRT